MADEIKLNRRQIEISGGRTMNFYTFELDGEPMAEMTEKDLERTPPSEQLEKPHG